jgi:hypothetical protein
MRISPEPLQPLRNWRELWQTDTTPATQILRPAGSFQSSQWKQPKNPAFHWLNHLLNRNLPD